MWTPRYWTVNFWSSNYWLPDIIEVDSPEEPTSVTVPIKSAPVTVGGILPANPSDDLLILTSWTKGDE